MSTQISTEMTSKQSETASAWLSKSNERISFFKGNRSRAPLDVLNKARFAALTVGEEEILRPNAGSSNFLQRFFGQGQE